MTHFHPKCFSLPKKTFKDSISDDGILEWLQNARNIEALDADQMQVVLQGIKENMASDPKRAAKAAAAAQKRKYAEMQEIIDLEDSDDDGSSASKKSKKNNPEYVQMEIFMKYNKMNMASLKQYLKWNRQMVGGTKDSLVERCKSGEIHGAIPPCPTCSEENSKSGTTLKLDPTTGSKCGGGVWGGGGGGQRLTSALANAFLFALFFRLQMCGLVWSGR